MIKYQQVDKEWWSLVDENNENIGWIRLTVLVICNKKYCNIDSSKCSRPENIVKTISKYAVWRNGQPMQLTDSLDGALKLVNKQ